jgi:hypothetical protein
MRMGKNAINQSAVLQVIGSERDFIVMKHAIDRRHTIMRIVDGLSLTKQRLRD